MTVAAYLRWTACYGPMDHPEVRTLLKSLINEINHIGNNINQIVKNNNSKLYFESDNWL